MKRPTLLAASVLILAGSSTAYPSPDAATTDAAEDTNPVNPTWAELTPDSVIVTSKGSFTVQTRLTGFDGCDAGRIPIIKQAFADALKIVGSVGNPHYILGKRSRFEEKPQEVYDYWGSEDNWKYNDAQTILSGNYERAQLTGDQTWLGDWWWDRYYNITCGDPEAGRCKDKVRAYETDANVGSNKDSKYHRINLCDKGANTFWTMPSLDQKVQMVKNGNPPKDHADSLTSQGSVLLHEMFHTKANSIGRDNNGGISSPKIVDVIPNGAVSGKCYGAARSKWLANRRTLRDSHLAFTNTDNYVYFALSRYMMQTLGVPYPRKPEAAWMINGLPPEPFEEPIDDLGGNDVVAPDLSLTAEALYEDPPRFYARILPLGASIVWGVGSSTGNGFRKPLRDALRQDGWKVNMVGSLNNGPMADSNVQAHSGDRIDQITAAVDSSIKYQPNIAVINAGTNDCQQSYDIANVGVRYGALLDKLFQQIPGVTIIVSTVLPGTQSGIVANRGLVNTQIKELVDDRRNNQNQKVVLADVDQPAGYFTTNLLVSDGIHPNDEGHQRLAAIVHRAIQEALWNGFLTEPKDTGISDEPGAPGSGDNTCDKVYGSGMSHGPVSTQSGSGLDDGIYSHSSQSMGIPSTYGWDADLNYTFARITKRYGPQDFVVINMQITPTDPLGWYLVYPNAGDGDYFGHDQQIEINMPDHCIARGVRFADVNADGLDDMLCISPNGDTYVSINNGDATFRSGPTLWKSNEGALQARVRIADIDGDGRADYCTIADNGDITCWRNWGYGDFPVGWNPLGVVFTGKGMGDVNGVRFADINGDGRDDWLWVSDTGETWTYTNNRGCTKGTLAPLWRAGVNSVGGAGSTHAGMGKQVGRNSIHFVNVYNSPWAFTLRGRSDYIWVEKTDDGYKFHTWKNTGGGATKLKADGDRYCRMIDRSKDAMDYVWIHSTGYMRIYESLGGTFPAPPGPYWGNNYIFWTASDYVGHEVDRRDLHLADWDGDGLCDIIYVTPDTGYMDGVWLNQYRTTRNLASSANWRSVKAGPHDSLAPCPERRGTHIYDLAVRFADIDGDGRADYLCIEKDGRAWGYLNPRSGDLQYISQFKKSEGKDRANLRWVDVNGDGRDDMLWLDKENGDASVWYNRGATPASGSAYTWDPKGAVYQGAMQGSCEHFPDLDGNGRADLHVTDGVENWATTWFNVCPGEGGSDNGDDADTMTAGTEEVTLPIVW